MICDKCGKSNIQGVHECIYCGARMPKLSGGGGFADILSYEHCTTTYDSKSDFVFDKENLSEDVRKSDVQTLIKKFDAILKITRRNLLFCMFAIVLGFIILLSSIVFGTVTVDSLKKYKKETITQLEQTSKKLSEYKTQLDVKSKNSDENEKNSSLSDTDGENTLKTNGGIKNGK